MRPVVLSAVLLLSACDDDTSAAPQPLEMVYENGLCGFQTARQRVVIPPRFEWCHEFDENNRAVVTASASHGDLAGRDVLIDETGQILSAGYYGIRRSERIYIADRGNAALSESATMDRNGQFLSPWYQGITDTVYGGYIGEIAPEQVVILSAEGRPVSETYTRVSLQGRESPLPFGVRAVDGVEYFFLLDAQYQEISPGYTAAEGCAEGLCVVGVGDFRSRLYGYIYDTGEVAIDFTFDIADEFKDGLAEVSRRQGNTFYQGLIDTTGATVVPLNNRDVFLRYEHVVLVQRSGDDYFFVSLRTGEDVSGPFEHVGGTHKGGFGLRFGANLSNVSVRSSPGDGMGKFVDGYMVVAVKEGGPFGFVDERGVVQLEPQYTELSSFSEGLAAFEEDGKWGYLDATGAVVIPPRFDDAKKFKGGQAVVEHDGEHWNIDPNGTRL